jgi:hypothetical protein
MHSPSSNIKPPSKVAAIFEDDIVMDEETGGHLREMSPLDFHPLANIFPLGRGPKDSGRPRGRSSRGRPVVALAKPCHSSK